MLYCLKDINSKFVKKNDKDQPESHLITGYTILNNIPIVRESITEKEREREREKEREE